MGLYDELLCFHPLPDGVAPAGQRFQTTDTPTQYLALYVLQDDGSLVEAATGAVVPFHGALTFYATNIVGVCRDGCLTRDARPPWEATYCALYDHGRLLTLEGQRTPITDLPLLTREAFARGVARHVRERAREGHQP